jgi:hypothetical protein
MKLKSYDMDVMWDQIKYDISQENFNLNTYVNARLVRFGSKPYIKNSTIHAINNALDRSIYIYIPDRTKSCAEWSRAQVLHRLLGVSLPTWTAIPFGLAAGAATRIAIVVMGGWLLPVLAPVTAVIANCLGGATGGLVYDAIAKSKRNHHQAIAAGVSCVSIAIGIPVLGQVAKGLLYIAQQIGTMIALRWVATQAPKIQQTIEDVMTEMAKMAMKKVLPS